MWKVIKNKKRIITNKMAKNQRMDLLKIKKKIISKMEQEKKLMNQNWMKILKAKIIKYC